MTDQIVEKLHIFLNERHELKKECEVIYLLVELRKLLDRRNKQGRSSNYSLVRFHADWILHIDKQYITAPMKEIMKKIDESIDIYPKDGNIKFLLLPEFRTELIKLIEEYGLPNYFCKNDNNWLVFMTTLTQVLADQPIINPTDNIAEFRYVNIKREGIMANINFRGAKAGKSITLGFGL
ncbi:MAG: hypothetical protein WCT24_03970 [Patescibacteria group bacterium]|jgi:hypothetical protein